MDSEQIQEKDPFPRTTHRIHEAHNPASAGKHHDITETFIMSQVPGSEEVEEKEDLSLSNDLALLFVMKGHMWDGSSNAEEKDTSQEPEKRPRDLENWEESSDGKQNPHSLKESRESSLNSFGGEFASYSSTRSQSFRLDTTSPAHSSLGRSSVGQMENQAHDSGFSQPPSLHDTHSQTWHEESAITDALLCQEDSVNESPLVIHNSSDCYRSAGFSISRSAEEHSWELETQHKENRSLHEGMDDATGINEISSQREEVSQRLSNPSSEEEELNLDGAQRKSDNISSQVSSQEAEEHSDVDDEIGDLEENVLRCFVLQLQEEEESDVGASNPLLLRKNIQTNYNISNVNCEESESDPKQLPTTSKPEFAELEVLEEEGGKDLKEKAAKSKTKTNLEEVQLPHNDQEEQEWTVQATIDSMPIRSGQDTLDSLENSLALFCLNDNSSEEFAFSLKEVSSADNSPTSGCALSEPCVQTTTIPSPGMTPTGFQPGSGSPRTQPAIYHSSGQVGHSGIYDEANTTLCWDQDGAQPAVGVGKEDIGKEGNVRSSDGEQITQLFTDVALGNDSPDLHGFQVVGCSSDAENNPVPSLRTIITALLQEEPSKGATDGATTCAGDESVLHFSSQLDREIGDEETLAPDSDGDDHLPAFGDDFVKGAQSSTSKKTPNPPSVEEGLSNIAKEMIKLSLSSWGSVQDGAKSHRQLKPTVQHAVVSSGKEAAADTHGNEEGILTSESPCFSVLGKERTECDCEADSLPSPGTPFAMITDAAQLTQPLAPVLGGDSGQTLALESLSSRRPLQFVIPPPAANFNAQPTPPGLNPDRLLEQLSSSSQVTPLAPKSSANETVLEHSPLAPETGLSQQLSTSESDLDQRCQVPHSVHYSKQPVPVSHRASLPSVSRRYVFPSLTSNAASQRTNSKQVTQPVAAGPVRNFPTPPPRVAVSRGSHSFRSDSNSRKHLLVRGNPSTQHRTETSENNPLVSRTGSDEPTHPSPQVGRHAYRNSSSVSKRGDLVPVSSLDNRTEEIPGLPLAACPELGLSLSDLQGEFLGNGATGADSFLSVPETASKFEDTPDGRSSRYTFRPAGDREKPCETKPTNVRQPPSLLAFTNPIHFLQLGPPSPPSDPYPGVHQDPQWPEQQTRHSEDPVASLSEGPGRFRKVFEKSTGESVCLAIHRKNPEGRHPLLEKSSSCPDKNTIGMGTKESAFGAKKQAAGGKQRAKSKDWHRHGLRKISIPTDGAVGEWVSLSHLFFYY